MSANVVDAELLHSLDIALVWSAKKTQKEGYIDGTFGFLQDSLYFT